MKISELMDGIGKLDFVLPGWTGYQAGKGVHRRTKQGDRFSPGVVVPRRVLSEG